MARIAAPPVLSTDGASLFPQIAGREGMEQVLRPNSTEHAWLAVGVLGGLLSLYVVALDQGLLLSLVQGAPAFDMNLIHELVHDARHAAGFPCH